MLDPAAIRAHFPALDPLNHGGVAPIFFDNPAGTQIAGEAMSRMQDYLVHRNANHGGAHRGSRESDAMVMEARRALADLFHAARPEEISFGQNMTSLTLHVSRSIAGGLRGDGGELAERVAGQSREPCITLRRFFRQAGVQQQQRHAGYAAGMDQVEPDFRFHQDAELRAESAQKIVHRKRIVVGQIYTQHAVTE